MTVGAAQREARRSVAFVASELPRERGFKLASCHRVGGGKLSCSYTVSVRALCAGRCLRCCNGSCDEDEGTCTGDECSEGTTCCPSGCENLQTNDKHCGACDHACAKTEHCASGMCITDCRLKGCPSAKYTCCTTAPNVYRCVDITSWWASATSATSMEPSRSPLK